MRHGDGRPATDRGTAGRRALRFAVPLRLPAVRHGGRRRGPGPGDLPQGAGPPRTATRLRPSQAVAVQHPAERLPAPSPFRPAGAPGAAGRGRRPRRAAAGALAGRRSRTAAGGTERTSRGLPDADYLVLFRGLQLPRHRRPDGPADRHGDVAAGTGQGPPARAAAAAGAGGRGRRSEEGDRWIVKPPDCCWTSTARGPANCPPRRPWIWSATSPAAPTATPPAAPCAASTTTSAPPS